MAQHDSTALRTPEPIRGHLTWESVDARLHAGRSIWLATTRPDGRALIAPVWYWWDADDADDAHAAPRLYFITARGTQKARNLAFQPWAEAHLGDGDEVLILRGRATRTHDRAETDRVDAAYRARYVDPGSGARASVYDNPNDDVYRLSVERVITWAYGTVAHWTEWRFSAPPEAGVPSVAEDEPLRRGSQ